MLKKILIECVLRDYFLVSWYDFRGLEAWGYLSVDHACVILFFYFGVVEYLLDIMFFLLDRVRVFDNAKKIHHVKHLFELFVNFTQIHIMLKVIPWDFIMEVSSNPWMLKSLLNGVPLTWLWVTKLFDESFCQFVKFPTVSQLFEVNCLSLVFDFVISFLPQWMLSSYHLIHNETSCPNIDSFSVELTALHLLRCLID
jgi:hypothetical protein